MQKRGTDYTTSLNDGPEKTFDDRCGYSSPRYTRENHYAFLSSFENFSGFHSQDKHNASSFFNETIKYATLRNID